MIIASTGTACDVRIIKYKRMKIGIIGAGISGLTAGRELVRAGHDVVVFEKSNAPGGRIATRRSNTPTVYTFDHGSPYLSGSSSEFSVFINELKENGIVREWTDSVSYYKDGKILPEIPGRDRETLYIAPEGMNRIGKYMARWLDFFFSEKVGGLTHIGGSRIKKSPWMINSSTINVFEADAVIIATPAIQAYGLVSTAQDELDLRKMISVLDEIPYNSTYSFMAGYGKRDLPDWSLVSCQHPVISWLSNESRKKVNMDELAIVAHTTHEFTREHIEDESPEATDREIKKGLGEVLGSWASRPEWSQSHLWRYKRPRKSLDMPFLESENDLAPLAVIGDYFQGTTLEAAYLSGLRLGKHWAEKLT